MKTTLKELKKLIRERIASNLYLVKGLSREMQLLAPSMKDAVKMYIDKMGGTIQNILKMNELPNNTWSVKFKSPVEDNSGNPSSIVKIKARQREWS